MSIAISEIYRYTGRGVSARQIDGCSSAIFEKSGSRTFIVSGERMKGKTRLTGHLGERCEKLNVIAKD